MKKALMVTLAVAALSLITAQIASAQCACRSDTQFPGTPQAQCVTTCCAAPNPNNPPNPANGACGEVCILGDHTTGVPQLDQLILVAGAANGSVQAGCVGLLGGTLHSGQLGPLPPAMPNPQPAASYSQCLADAAAACDANGCGEVVSTTAGPCS